MQSNASDDTTLPLGEPFTPTVALPEWVKKNIERGGSLSNIRLEFLVHGSGKEVVTDLRKTASASSRIEVSSRYSYRPKEPTYKIINADGKVVKEDSFKYG